MSNIQLINNLRNLRKSHLLTQKDIARMLNISRQAYSNYETGTRSPDIDLLIRLSQIYTITLDELVNQTFTVDGMIRERKGPHFTGVELDSGDTMYLTVEEVHVIQKYRTLVSDNKRIVDQFLNHQ